MTKNKGPITSSVIRKIGLELSHLPHVKTNTFAFIQHKGPILVFLEIKDPYLCIFRVDEVIADLGRQLIEHRFKATIEINLDKGYICL